MANFNNAKTAIIFAKGFAISGYAWYTVWALIDRIQKCNITGGNGTPERFERGY